MHVPLLIHFPRKWQHLAPGKPGSTTNRLVSFVDYAPTVLNLLGLPTPRRCRESRSLARTLPRRAATCTATAIA